MTERTIMSVVSDLVKTGLTVEQQILVNELILVASAQQVASDREYERERKRAYRLSRDMRDNRGHLGQKEKVSHTLPKENITPLDNPKGLSSPQPKSADALHFEHFWQVYPRKIGKGAARKAYRNACQRAFHDEIIVGAERYAASKPDPQFTKHPTTWLNADCWLDEAPKSNVVCLNGPRRTWAEIKAEREKQPSG